MNGSLDLDLPGRPLSVKEIAEQADHYDWNANVALKFWARTAQMLYKQADIYLHEGNLGRAYLIFLRWSSLVTKDLMSHPEAKTPDGKKTLRPLLKQLPIVLTNLEKIKPFIEQDYEKWEASEARRNESRDAQRRESRPTSYEIFSAKDPALSARSTLLNAGDHQELAVDLAQNEFQRRDADRRATRQAGVSREEEAQRRTAGFWENWESAIAERQHEDEDDFRKNMEITRRRLDGGEDDHINDFVHRMQSSERELERPNIARAQRSNYQYPSISKPQSVSYEPEPPQASRQNTPRPARPPKESWPLPDNGLAQPPLPPELPSKSPLEGNGYLATPELGQDSQPARPPKIAELVSPTNSTFSKERYTFKPSAYLENGEPIRSIFLPSKLRQDFLEIASDNTRRGLEMCGILCGSVANNALFVRCLLIPEQRCTSDTCETENEGSMLDYCINEDLLMLGWIHTHPTQTCFMSSRDLHTQAGYQVMLPESIAIVCAPKFEPDYGIFRLTNPPGLPHILSCNQTTTLHPHSVDNLYTGALHPPGHVYESDKLQFYVHDLRPGASSKKI